MLKLTQHEIELIIFGLQKINTSYLLHAEYAKADEANTFYIEKSVDALLLAKKLSGYLQNKGFQKQQLSPEEICIILTGLKKLNACYTTAIEKTTCSMLDFYKQRKDEAEIFHNKVLAIKIEFELANGAAVH